MWRGWARGWQRIIRCRDWQAAAGGVGRWLYLINQVAAATVRGWHHIIGSVLPATLICSRYWYSSSAVFRLLKLGHNNRTALNLVIKVFWFSYLDISKSPVNVNRYFLPCCVDSSFVTYSILDLKWKRRMSPLKTHRFHIYKVQSASSVFYIWIWYEFF